MAIQVHNTLQVLSSQLKKQSIPVAHCLERYSKLQTDPRGSFFGTDIMMQCTTMGHRRFPALHLLNLVT